MLQRFFLKKKDRIIQKKTIQKLFLQGIQINIYPYRVFILKTGNSLTVSFKVLISVPKKQFKLAVHRNLIKRRIREAYRLNKHILTQTELKPEIQISIAFVYYADEIHEYDFICLKMLDAMEKIKYVINNKMV